MISTGRCGRGWAVVHIQHDDRRVIVEPAPRGRQPTWGGYLPQFLGQQVCQKVLDILTSAEDYTYLSTEAATIVRQRRDEMRRFLRPKSGGIQAVGEVLQRETRRGTMRQSGSSRTADIESPHDNVPESSTS